ncbi:MAG: hypothetical protein JO022_16365 [Acidobacteriaceae bacterium]|nr:hypothetical protein [Acidobacteriaceae bacterium]
MRIDVKLAIAALALSASLHGAESWKMQYLYDQDRSELEIRDLQCASSKLCVAAAVVGEQGKSKAKGALVISSDGGEHWQLQDVSEPPYSLFFLNEANGWMITDKGIWRTQDSAKSWKKINPTKGLERLYFLDESHGFAAGEQKTILETEDGGKKWTKREITDPRPMEARDVLYSGIAFEGPQHGVIWGSWNPMQRAQEAEWMVLNPAKRPKTQMSSLLLESSDGGKDWKPFEVKVNGNITHLRFLSSKAFLMLVEYVGANAGPSEIFQLTSKESPELRFRQEGRSARDFAILPGGEMVVATVESLGKSSDVPIPGKLRMMASSDLKNWHDEKADYRAVAKRPFLAAPDAEHVIVATDTGMILKRVAEK